MDQINIVKELAEEKLKREKLKTTALATATKTLQEKRIMNEKAKEASKLANWEKKASLQESAQQKIVDDKIKTRHEQLQMQKELIDLKKTLTLERENDQRQHKLKREEDKARKAKDREKERQHRQEMKDEALKARQLKQQEAKDQKEALRTKTAQLKAELQEKKIKLANDKLDHQNHQLQLQKLDEYDEDHVEQMVQAIAQDRKVLAEEKTDFKTVGGISFKLNIMKEPKPFIQSLCDITYTAEHKKKL